MARLSRSSRDLRTNILLEFSGAIDDYITDREEFAGSERARRLMDKVMNQYGDDSVQQLASFHAVIEGPSNLLTKHLEWGRLMAYLEQSTRYIPYDEKDDVGGTYRYIKPPEVNPEMSEAVAEDYSDTMEALFDNYSQAYPILVDHIRDKFPKHDDMDQGAWKRSTRAKALDIARSMLPVAARSTVGMHGTGQAFDNLLMRLPSLGLHEASQTGKKLLTELREVDSTFFKRTDRPDRGRQKTWYMEETRLNMEESADKYLPEKEDYEEYQDNQAKLINYTHENALNLVDDFLIASSNLPREEIQDRLAQLSDQEKLEIFRRYAGERPNRRYKPHRAFELPHYQFDIVCDYGAFRDLQRHRMVDDLEWQPLTPYMGFPTPQEAKDAGVAELFEQSINMSLGLYERMRDSGLEREAQYATLLGHKMRWKLTVNARSAMHICELRTTPQAHPSYKKVAIQMYEAIASVNPLIAESMQFVNLDERDQLERLASEQKSAERRKKLEQDN